MFFFFKDTATTEVYPLSLHDALPISDGSRLCAFNLANACASGRIRGLANVPVAIKGITSSALFVEHTSELQPPFNLVPRLLPENKKKPLASGRLRLWYLRPFALPLYP